jgi:hypothetical protein
MGKSTKRKNITNHLVLMILLLFNLGCSSQQEEQLFLNKTSDEDLKKIIKKIRKIEDYGRKNYRFTDLNKPKSDGGGFEFNQIQSKKYLGFPKDSLYDRVEYYNHDEDIRTYGDTKEIFPYTWIKAFLTENLISLFVAKSNGVNDGDLDMYYLFVLDYKGNLVDQIVLSKRMITYDGIRPNHFGFLDKNHFNRYIYDFKKIDDSEQGVIYSHFCIVEKYEINDKGKITLIKTKQKELDDDPNFNHGRYSNLNEIPKDDPMRIFIDH